jgi:hypothetical protein
MSLLVIENDRSWPFQRIIQHEKAEKSSKENALDRPVATNQPYED